MVIWLRRCAECSLPSISMEPSGLSCPHLRMWNERNYIVPNREKVPLLCRGFRFERRTGVDFGAPGLEAGIEQGSEAAFTHLAFEGGVVCVVDGLKSKCGCGGDVLFPVIDEEDVGRRGVQGFGGLEVDGRLRLCHEQGMRPGAVVEA